MTLYRNGLTYEEWLAHRRLGIGSSDAAAVMGVSPWATAFELFLEKTGRIMGRVRNTWEWKAMRRGLELEPEARRAYEEKFGIQMPAKMIIHPKYPQLRATCDGLNREIGRALEIKAPGKKDHAVFLKKKIPRKYFWQGVHIMMVEGLEWIHYWSYRNGSGVPVGLQRDPFQERRLMERELAFWKRVEWDDPRGLLEWSRNNE